MAAVDDGAVKPGSPEALEFGRLLRERYKALWQDVQRETEKYRSQQYADLIEAVPDAGDSSMADLLVDLNIAELNRDVAEMRAVQQALERLNAGTYGVCLECGEPIPRERLRAVPEATTCVRCVTRTAEAVDTTPSL